MRLSTLMDVAGVRTDLFADPEVYDVAENSGEVKYGWLFVAVKGHSLDGHEYVDDAVRRGAVAIVSQRAVTVPVPNIVVNDSRALLADCAAAINGFPSKRLRVYGVTGTDGKTTTCYLLRSVLEASGRPTGMLTTVEACIGGRWQPTPGRMTTPGAPQVQRSLAGMLAGGDVCVVVESSSHALTQHRLRNVTYRAATITNIASDHLDFHTSRERYINAKASLLDQVAGSAGIHIALNADDVDSMNIARRLSREYLTYGVTLPADVRARDVRTEDGCVRFRLEAQGREIDVRLPMWGDYNAYNALAAATLAITEDVPLEVIADGLGRARVPAGRLQKIDCGQQFDVFVDYAHTEQAFSTLLAYLSRLAGEHGGRLLAVFGAAGDRDRSKRKNLAIIAREHAEFFVITNEDPFGEDPDAIMTEIASGANPEEAGTRWTIQADRRLALKLALEMARPGDVVAVTGKGHEHAIAVGRESLPWNDAEAIREMLRSGD